MHRYEWVHSNCFPLVAIIVFPCPWNIFRKIFLTFSLTLTDFVHEIRENDIQTWYPSIMRNPHFLIDVTDSYFTIRRRNQQHEHTMELPLFGAYRTWLHWLLRFFHKQISGFSLYIIYSFHLIYITKICYMFSETALVNTYQCVDKVVFIYCEYFS